MKNDCLVVIPARLASTRLPGKVLAVIGGLPLVEWCRRAALRAAVGPVLVATDDVKVLRAVEYYGGQAVLTSNQCLSGSDRVWEVARRRRERLILNLQSDEPFIKPTTIRRVSEILRNNDEADIATAVIPLDSRRAEDPNVVKAAMGQGGRCLYFSRAPVPYFRSAPAARWQHIGIYGFRRAALERFVALAPSPLERAESLEQLRALEAGMSIFAAKAQDAGIAVDTKEDLGRAARHWASSRGKGAVHV